MGLSYDWQVEGLVNEWIEGTDEIWTAIRQSMTQGMILQGTPWGTETVKDVAHGEEPQLIIKPDLQNDPNLKIMIPLRSLGILSETYDQLSKVEKVAVERQMERLLALPAIAFRVQRTDYEASLAIASRQEALNRMAKRTWSELESGQTRRIAVAHFVTRRYAYLDIGGIIGRLQLGEAPYGVTDFNDCLYVGKATEVQVLRYNRERGRIIVSMRALQEDPWKRYAAQFQKGSIYTGTVTAIRPFGLFTELAPGVTAKLELPARFTRKGRKIQEGDSVIFRLQEYSEARRQASGWVLNVVPR